MKLILAAVIHQKFVDTKYFILSANMALNFSQLVV